MKMPIKYIHAECLNFLKCALMYGLKKSYFRKHGEMGSVCVSVCAYMEKRTIGWSLLQITDITPAVLV